MSTPIPPVAMPPVYMIAPSPMPMQLYPTPSPPPNPDDPPPIAGKFGPSIVRVNDLRLLVHEQLNIFTQQWEEFSPPELPMEDLNIAFVIRSRIQRTPSRLVLLEIRSDALKRCWRSVSVLDVSNLCLTLYQRYFCACSKGNIRFMPTNYSVKLRAWNQN